MPAVDVYSTAVQMKGSSAPSHAVTELDRRRCLAYYLYENLYRNSFEAFAGSLRDTAGEELSRRLVPVARKVIEATNRYLAANPHFSLPAQPAGGTNPTEEQAAAAVAALNSLWEREEVLAKLLSLKRWTLTRGDGIWHLTADMSKPPGSRLSISELTPDAYFPIHDPLNSERVIGCYLVNIVDVDDQTQVAMRMEYRRILTPEDSANYSSPIGTVWQRLSFWEPDGWDDRAEHGLSEEDLAPAAAAPSWAGSPSMAAILQGTTLPARITSIPVYHFRNQREGAGAFGVSELQGMETLLAGITQVATDEDISVVLQGIGVYWTDSGKPTDESGQEVDWEISPATILELEAGKKIGRLQGATDITSLLQHRTMLEGGVQDGTGTPSVAFGSVDQAPESGVALEIRFAPIVSKNREKELELSSRLNHLVYDLLNGWFPEFEQLDFSGVLVHVDFDDALPIDRAAVFSEIMEMVKNKILSASYARRLLNERLGYQIPEEVGTELLDEQAAVLDMTGTRLDEAMPGDGEPA